MNVNKRLLRHLAPFYIFSLILGLHLFILPAHAENIESPPGPPRGPAIAAKSGDTVTIRWENPLTFPEKVLDYEFRVSSDAGSSWSKLEDGFSTETEFEVTGLDRNLDYLIQVRSIGSAGFSDWVLVSPTPEESSVIDFAYGMNSFCALRSAGTIDCVGREGPWLGHGSTSLREVVGISNATQISVGSTHACALLSDMTIRCWGENDYGQLGDGTTNNSPSPVAVNNQNVFGDSNVVQVQVLPDGRTTCALHADKILQCWGKHRHMRSAVVQFGVGADRICALGSDGIVTCFFLWEEVDRTFDLGNVLHVSVGATHACALISDGTIQCWGWNNSGQLGDSTTTNRTLPVSVQGISSAVNVSAGGLNTCALLSNNDWKCWGAGVFGKLRDGSFISHFNPVVVERDAPIRKFHDQCTLLVSGDIDCRGSWLDEVVNVQSQFPKGFVRLPALPSSPEIFNVQSRSTSSIEFSWSRAFGDFLPIDEYRVAYSLDGTNWSYQSTTSQSLRLVNLPIASRVLAKVASHSAAGWGEFGQMVETSTTGTRAMRLVVKSAAGLHVTGGAVTWQSTDGAFSASQAYGLNVNGELLIPRAPATKSIIVADNLQLSDGTYVSGSWEVMLGSEIHELIVPAGPAISSHKVRVKMPNGLPISGVSVLVSGLSKKYWDGSSRFSFRTSAFMPAGLTDSAGEFVATGLGYGLLLVTARYDDGILIQTKQVPVQNSSTEITFDEMPSVVLATVSKTAKMNSLVSISLRVVEPTMSRLRGMQVLTTSSKSVEVVPPPGAAQKCKGRILRGSPNALGIVTLKVCATKSGFYTFKTKGVVATGSLLLKVNGSSPMSVQKLRGVSTKLGNASFTWKSPVFSGGTPVTQYVVSLKGGGKTIKKTVKKPSASFSNLKNGTMYVAYVQAVTKYGVGEPSSVTLGVA